MSFGYLTNVKVSFHPGGGVGGRCGGSQSSVRRIKLRLSWRWGYYIINPISYLSYLSLDRRDRGWWQTHVKKAVLGQQGEKLMDMDLQIINDFSCHFLKNESYARCLSSQTDCILFLCSLSISLHSDNIIQN